MFRKQFRKLLAVYLGLTALWLLVQGHLVTHSRQVGTLFVFVFIMTGLFATLNYYVASTKSKCFYYSMLVIDAVLALIALVDTALAIYSVYLLLSEKMIGLEHQATSAKTILALIAVMCLRVCFVIVLCLMTTLLLDNRESTLAGRSTEDFEEI